MPDKSLRVIHCKQSVLLCLFLMWLTPLARPARAFSAPQQKDGLWTVARIYKMDSKPEKEVLLFISTNMQEKGLFFRVG